MVVASHSGAVKMEKPQGHTISIGTASSITIGKKQEPRSSGSGQVIKILSPQPTTSSAGNKNVQVVRVLNAGASTSSASPRVIQVQQKPTPPRILNQSLGHSEVKMEPSGSRPVTIVRKSVNDEYSGNEEPASPPSKKTKYITLTTSQINQIEGATIMGGGKSKRIVMLPSNYREQLDKMTRPVQTTSNQTTFKIVQEVKKEDKAQLYSGKKTKRPCNCTKSQCLKFYCDCFAAGEYCEGCNCKDCLNDQESEEREKAVKMCLERNPLAFKSKESAEEQARLHQRGCNCKRSGCLKNYCECYEAKISCSANCRCLGKLHFQSNSNKLTNEAPHFNFRLQER